MSVNNTATFSVVIDAKLPRALLHRKEHVPIALDVLSTGRMEVVHGGKSRVPGDPLTPGLPPPPREVPRPLIFPGRLLA